LCPSFTFFATAGCIARTGATPVFVDSHVDTFNLNAEDAAAKVTDCTKAILPVHLFGQAADMTAIGQLAQTHSLHIIEDAAQAQGATWEGIPVGGMGDFGAFSFYPTKNLGALGDAGLLTTSNDALAERARVLRNHGMQPKYHHAHVGGNFRLDELQAALLRVKQTQLDEWIALRTGNAAQYQSLLAGTPDLILPAAAPGHSWNQFTVRLPNRERRDALAAHLRAAEIGNEIYYPDPLHQQPCFAHLPSANCLVAEQLADQVLSLPVSPEMTEAQVTEVAQSVIAFCA
jgi:dTDP-4-amino-4,6-dideoxygalactose transaminase